MKECLRHNQPASFSQQKIFVLERYAPPNLKAAGLIIPFVSDVYLLPRFHHIKALLSSPTTAPHSNFVEQNMDNKHCQLQFPNSEYQH